MKTNHFLAAGAAALAIVIVACWQSPASGQGSGMRQQYQSGLQNGRFLLYQSAYEVTTRPPKENANGAAKADDAAAEVGLFKIDTANGRVWKYEETIDAARNISRSWVEIDPR